MIIKKDNKNKIKNIIQDFSKIKKLDIDCGP